VCVSVFLHVLRNNGVRLFSVFLVRLVQSKQLMRYSSMHDGAGISKIFCMILKLKFTEPKAEGYIIRISSVWFLYLLEYRGIGLCS